LTVFQGGELAFVVVVENDVVAEVGEAGASHQSYVSGTDDSEVHFKLQERKILERL